MRNVSAKIMWYQALGNENRFEKILTKSNSPSAVLRIINTQSISIHRPRTKQFSFIFRQHLSQILQSLP